MDPNVILDYQCEIIMLQDKLDWALVAAKDLYEGIRGKTIKQVEKQLEHLIEVLKR